MARAPVIESPCPIAGKALPAGATEHCTLCDRAVHNLDVMSERQRVEFMSGCGGKVCVAYTVRIPRAGSRKRALTAAALAASALASLPVAAQDSGVEGRSNMPDPNGLPDCDYYDIVLTGGISRGDQAEWADDDDEDAPPELPTIVDDGK